MSRFRFYNADCFSLMRDMEPNSVDLVLTDPPYAISQDSGYTNTKVAKYATHTIDFGEWDKVEIDLNILADHCYRILRKGGTAIIFYDLWKITKLATAFEEAKFKQKRFIQWIKTNPVPINAQTNYLSNAREIAVSFVKGGKPTFHSKYDNGNYIMPIHRESRIHPTQKPLALMEALISKHSNPGDVVFDPFAGAGTTGLASVLLAREWIGVERDARYCEAGGRRIKEGTAQERLIA